MIISRRTNGSRSSSIWVTSGRSLGESIFFTWPSVGHDFVADGGRGLNNVNIVFAFEAFLDDFHMQKAQEAAPETESQGRRILRHE